MIFRIILTMIMLTVMSLNSRTIAQETLSVEDSIAVLEFWHPFAKAVLDRDIRYFKDHSDTTIFCTPCFDQDSLKYLESYYPNCVIPIDSFTVTFYDVVFSDHVRKAIVQYTPIAAHFMNKSLCVFYNTGICNEIFIIRKINGNFKFDGYTSVP